MRYTLALALLAFLTAAPVRAQQEGAQEKTSAPAATEQEAAYEELEVKVPADWAKLESHWEMVESASGPAKAEHLEMHRRMLADYMPELDKYAKQEEGEEMPDAAFEKWMASVGAAQEHWQMVQGIKDPEQLETHLDMHMDMLEKIADGDSRLDAADEDDNGHEMDHDMDHEGMQHGEAGHGKPEGGHPPKPDKPAGY
jgi:hypothetical protein